MKAKFTMVKPSQKHGLSSVYLNFVNLGDILS